MHSARNKAIPHQNFPLRIKNPASVAGFFMQVFSRIRDRIDNRILFHTQCQCLYSVIFEKHTFQELPFHCPVHVQLPYIEIYFTASFSAFAGRNFGVRIAGT